MSCISEKLGLESISRIVGGGETPFHVLWEEVVRLVVSQVDLILASDSHEGTGVLYLTTKRVVWLSEEKGYGIDYPSIIVHATSTDPLLHDGRSCVYLQLEVEDDDEELEPVMTFLPQDQSKMEEIFQVLSECSALNPDPEGDSDSEAELGGFSEEQRQDLEELLGDDPERFQDPSEEEEEEDDHNEQKTT